MGKGLIERKRQEKAATPGRERAAKKKRNQPGANNARARGRAAAFKSTIDVTPARGAVLLPANRWSAALESPGIGGHPMPCRAYRFPRGLLPSRENGSPTHEKFRVKGLGSAPNVLGVLLQSMSQGAPRMSICAVARCNPSLVNRIFASADRSVRFLHGNISASVFQHCWACGMFGGNGNEPLNVGTLRLLGGAKSHRSQRRGSANVHTHPVSGPRRRVPPSAPSGGVLWLLARLRLPVSERKGHSVIPPIPLAAWVVCNSYAGVNFFAGVLAVQPVGNRDFAPFGRHCFWGGAASLVISNAPGATTPLIQASVQFSGVRRTG